MIMKRKKYNVLFMCETELQNVYTRWSSYSRVFILGGDELPAFEERFMAWTINVRLGTM